MNDIKTKAKKAIKMAKYHKSIHVKWKNYLRNNPNYSGDAGGIKHHEQCIRRYNFFISLFKELTKKHKKNVYSFGSFDNCDIKVTISSLSNIDEGILKGRAGFSKSGKTCFVWYDDSSCDKFMKHGDSWKIPGLPGQQFRIERA